MAYRIAFQLYSARHFPPLAGQLPLLAEMGYDAVEPWMPALSDPAGFRRMIDDAGLACTGYHADFDGVTAEPQRFIDLAGTIGARLIIPPWLSPMRRPRSAGGWRRIGEKLGRAAQTVSDAGMRLAWHNHDFEFKPLKDGSRPIDHLFAAAGDGLGFEIDCAWIVRAGADPAEALARFSRRIAAIQVKDSAPSGTTSEDGWAAPGQGVIDWPAIWPLMRDTPADHLVVEHDNPADWTRLARDAIAYLGQLDRLA